MIPKNVPENLIESSVARNLTYREVERAVEVVGRIAQHTPLLASRQLSTLAGTNVLLKAENLQRTGSFKIRGAVNKVASLSHQQRQRGVIAASAGNHAQGVALAAGEMDTACTVVMPTGASLAKVEATRGYGAEVILCGENFDQALLYSQELALARGTTFVHAFDDPMVVAGQGTLGVEICEDVAEPAMVIVPVGGGGLIAGVALAIKTLSPRTRVVGVQAAASPAAARSLRRGRRLRVATRTTVADGIAIAQPGRLPWRLIRRYVDEIVTVSEESIAHAQVLLLERAKLLVEGAGAVGLAALLEHSVELTGKEAVVVLSGGNVDLNLVSRILEHGLAKAGRYQVLEVVLLDRPGELGRFLEVLAEAGVNVLDVDHQRHAVALPLGQVVVQITGETRNAAHAAEVAQALEKADYILVGVPVARGGGRAMRFVAREAQS